jgi:hypothetical protein
MKKILGIILIFSCIGQVGAAFSNQGDKTILFLTLPCLIGGIILIISFNKDKKNRELFILNQKAIQEQKKQEKQNEIDEFRKNNFEKLEKLNIQLLEILKINTIEISDYKKIINENENLIIDKGGDNQLFVFMKINTFLNDYNERINLDKEELKEKLDINLLKLRIESESTRSINKNSTKLDNLFDLEFTLKPTFENQINTLEYYRNISLAMIVFYLTDKKIRYYEIYQAFERLGIFDNSWQKNVLNKLEKIEVRFLNKDNQLTDFNQNFELLFESYHTIISELEQIGGDLLNNILLHEMVTYKPFRKNKKNQS